MELNMLFRNGMVLAANKPIRIFGKGRGHVRVAFLNMTAECESSGEDWLVEIPGQPYGGPYEMTVTLNGMAHTISDIYVGEVLLLHGQSNIMFCLAESSYPVEQYEDEPHLHLFSLGYLTEKSRFLPHDGWVRCKRENAGEWSAIGYHVGLRIARERGCAVGLIACYQGASIIQSWLPEGTEARLGIRLTPAQRHMDSSYPLYKAWNREGVLYHFAVEAITPYSLSHVIWYQGESNTTEAEGAVYDRLLTALVEQRRIDFDTPGLPFVVVQLADLQSRCDAGWRAVQEAQARVGETLAGVKTVVCRDVCETDNIHPATKIRLSERICDAILEKIK